LATEPFQIRVPSDQTLTVTEDGVHHVPKGAVQMLDAKPEMKLSLPHGYRPQAVEDRDGNKIYSFPAHTRIHYEPVSKMRLALVVSQSVAIICLWGTLVGSMLPLAFKRFGVDPGIASSPFVATFVDVTGIIIYFSFATAYLL
jgi:magnesium transporter